MLQLLQGIRHPGARVSQPQGRATALDGTLPQSDVSVSCGETASNRRSAAAAHDSPARSQHRSPPAVAAKAAEGHEPSSSSAEGVEVCHFAVTATMPNEVAVAPQNCSNSAQRHCEGGARADPSDASVASANHSPGGRGEKGLVQQSYSEEEEEKHDGRRRGDNSAMQAAREANSPFDRRKTVVEWPSQLSVSALPQPMPMGRDPVRRTESPPARIPLAGPLVAATAAAATRASSATGHLAHSPPKMRHEKGSVAHARRMERSSPSQSRQPQLHLDVDAVFLQYLRGGHRSGCSSPAVGPGDSDAAVMVDSQGCGCNSKGGSGGGEAAADNFSANVYGAATVLRERGSAAVIPKAYPLDLENDIRRARRRRRVRREHPDTLERNSGAVAYSSSSSQSSSEDGDESPPMHATPSPRGSATHSPALTTATALPLLEVELASRLAHGRPPASAFSACPGPLPSSTRSSSGAIGDAASRTAVTLERRSQALCGTWAMEQSWVAYLQRFTQLPKFRKGEEGEAVACDGAVITPPPSLSSSKPVVGQTHTPVPSSLPDGDLRRLTQEILQLRSSLLLVYSMLAAAGDMGRGDVGHTAIDVEEHLETSNIENRHQNWAEADEKREVEEKRRRRSATHRGNAPRGISRERDARARHRHGFSSPSFLGGSMPCAHLEARRAKAVRTAAQELVADSRPRSPLVPPLPLLHERRTSSAMQPSADSLVQSIDGLPSLWNPPSRQRRGADAEVMCGMMAVWFSGGSDVATDALAIEEKEARPLERESWEGSRPRMSSPITEVSQYVHHRRRGSRRPRSSSPVSHRRQRRHQGDTHPEHARQGSQTPILRGSWRTCFLMADDHGIYVYPNEGAYVEFAEEQLLMALPYTSLAFLVPDFKRAAAASTAVEKVAADQGLDDYQNHQQQGRQSHISLAAVHTATFRTVAAQLVTSDSTDEFVLFGFLHRQTAAVEHRINAAARTSTSFTSDPLLFSRWRGKGNEHDATLLPHPPLLLRTSSRSAHAAWVHFFAHHFNEHLYHELFHIRSVEASCAHHPRTRAAAPRRPKQQQREEEEEAHHSVEWQEEQQHTCDLGRRRANEHPAKQHHRGATGGGTAAVSEGGQANTPASRGRQTEDVVAGKGSDGDAESSLGCLADTIAGDKAEKDFTMAVVNPLPSPTAPQRPPSGPSVGPSERAVSAAALCGAEEPWWDVMAALRRTIAEREERLQRQECAQEALTASLRQRERRIRDLQETQESLAAALRSARERLQNTTAAAERQQQEWERLREAACQTSCLLGSSSVGAASSRASRPPSPSASSKRVPLVRRDASAVQPSSSVGTPRRTPSLTSLDLRAHVEELQRHHAAEAERWSVERATLEARCRSVEELVRQMRDADAAQLRTLAHRVVRDLDDFRREVTGGVKACAFAAVEQLRAIHLADSQGRPSSPEERVSCDQHSPRWATAATMSTAQPDVFASLRLVLDPNVEGAGADTRTTGPLVDGELTVDGSKAQLLFSGPTVGQQGRRWELRPHGMDVLLRVQMDVLSIDPPEYRSTPKQSNRPHKVLSSAVPASGLSRSSSTRSATKQASRCSAAEQDGAATVVSPRSPANSPPPWSIHAHDRRDSHHRSPVTLMPPSVSDGVPSDALHTPSRAMRSTPRPTRASLLRQAAAEQWMHARLEEE